MTAPGPAEMCPPGPTGDKLCRLHTVSNQHENGLRSPDNREVLKYRTRMCSVVEHSVGHDSRKTQQNQPS
jgi:hypothetical protein